MSDCLIAWSDGTLPGPPSPQIFANTILTNNPRLGFAPHLWHNNFGSGLAFRAIETFSLVYVSGLWFDDRGSTEFHPDDQAYDPIVMGNWRDVEQVTAFLLDDEMVSEYVLLTVGKLRSVIFEPTLFE